MKSTRDEATVAQLSFAQFTIVITRSSEKDVDHPRWCLKHPGQSCSPGLILEILKCPTKDPPRKAALLGHHPKSKFRVCLGGARLQIARKSIPSEHLNQSVPNIAVA